MSNETILFIDEDTLTKEELKNLSEVTQYEQTENSKEFRESLALQFIRLLSEKELHWKQGWLSDTPFNAVTQKLQRNQCLAPGIDGNGDEI